MDKRRRHMKASGEAGGHDGTFCPGLRPLHNLHCAAYGAGGLHGFYWDVKWIRKKPLLPRNLRLPRPRPEIDWNSREIIHTPTQLRTYSFHLLIHFLTELLVFQSPQTSYYDGAGLCVCVCHPWPAPDSRKNPGCFLTHAQMSAYSTFLSPLSFAFGSSLLYIHLFFIFSRLNDRQPV